MADNTFDILETLVATVTCKPGWTFKLVDEDGALRLVIKVPGLDARDPHGRRFTVRHFFPVPTVTYNERSWRRWVFDRCLALENHEMGEWFQIGDERPFAPLHGPGEDPYTIHEYRDVVDAMTRQDGSI